MIFSEPRHEPLLVELLLAEPHDPLLLLERRVQRHLVDHPRLRPTLNYSSLPALVVDSLHLHYSPLVLPLLLQQLFYLPLYLDHRLPPQQRLNQLLDILIQLIQTNLSLNICTIYSKYEYMIHNLPFAFELISVLFCLFDIETLPDLNLLVEEGLLLLEDVDVFFVEDGFEFVLVDASAAAFAFLVG